MSLSPVPTTSQQSIDRFDVLSSPPQTSIIVECIDWIDQHCDRTFLHAVIASDYHFLYRGITTSTMPFVATTVPVMERVVSQPATTIMTSLRSLLQQPTIQYDIPDLLDIETYGKDGLQWFQRLESILQNETIRPSIGHLGTTIPTEAAIWGNYSASIWPLSRVLLYHNDSTKTSIPTKNSYAWFHNGGLFYPRPNIHQSSSDEIRRSIRIVDGECHNNNDDDNDSNDGNDNNIDSLVDALQYKDGCEIMFTANTYLAVPSIYDTALRDQLRQSFLI